MDTLPPEIRAYDDRGKEAERLAGEFPSGPLELARTQELILRHVPDGTLDVLDVGGGPGVYAAWLSGLGHRVRAARPVEQQPETLGASSHLLLAGQA